MVVSAGGSGQEWSATKTQMPPINLGGAGGGIAGMMVSSFLGRSAQASESI